MIDSLVPLVDALAGARGTVAVVLGGSRAAGVAHAGSDWDLGVYYRGDFDPAPLARFGTVHPPGSWGRIMNGGAWLAIDGAKVDVLFRDLDVVERWSARAQEGEFEVDALLGYLAGIPTYSLMAERAVGVTLRGALPGVDPYPAKLAASAPARWRFCADFSLEYARMQAERGNVAGAVGQAIKALMEEAHGRVAAEGRWVLNEKHLLEAAGLSFIQAQLGAVPPAAGALAEWVAGVRDTLGRTR